MRSIVSVAVLIGVLLVLAIFGVHGSFTIGALAIFAFGALAGRLVSRHHKWVAAAGACAAVTFGLLAISLQDRGDDPWWELIAVLLGVATVAAAAVWWAGVWFGANMRPDR